ncbi:CDP-alcohol phosphatidyltransferase family protein [Clostridium sp. 'White wine YQ']|uniref:CDP-alcohol phosphatidyltransferase family protein n=1 Tax=Clostridium sp. 'White wine YQ' TaxID=3027474 RepID=UPI0023659829|nr:CDP-alcohol phosphatidyltransferase family protein [Clostridium sp. 'White wine YQ']MDD7793613.1 CDP-alcohol phosphatidyltransferase family protein [Clostridium sp. 'White wine YQ']
MKKSLSKLPNIITSLRILLSIAFAYLILNQSTDLNKNFEAISLIFLGICFSDFIDGKIARKTGNTTVLGAKLDVFADLFYMTLSYSALIMAEKIHLWFLGFILIKFLEFTVTSNFMRNYNKESENLFVFDKLGRITAGSFYIIPGITCLLSFIAPYYGQSLIKYLLYLTLIAGIYSSSLRIKKCLEVKNINVLET